ncbi:hypothetical protein B0H15DRAFT_848489 [Mycena belliarum]|uniref:Uncharacterized protein n=1 Tax=Mycena belliarum TaxID=1033014 RepID=A0AAD6XSF1_9AGAR|nr:hypothetical protein B0H15DRAFT_848489 [Mycena belliae]
MFLNTMASPIRHPWFDKPSTKRKHPSGESSYPSPKRRRSSTLEHGFASLTLDAPMFPAVEEPAPARPATPAAPEITMKTSSWYEPEPDRIVVTDLDSPSDEEVDGDAPPLVSPALIDRLKSRPLQHSLPAPSHSQALVLFRPLIAPPPPETKPTVNETDRYGADAMDVEP